MGYRVDLMQRPTDEVLGVPISTPASEVGTAIGSAIERLFTRAAETGLQPCGPPEVTYLGEFVADSDVPAEIQVDLPVSGHVEGVAGARHRMACQVARTVHRGTYAPNALGNFEFEVTLSYRRLERPRRVQGGE